MVKLVCGNMQTRKFDIEPQKTEHKSGKQRGQAKTRPIVSLVGKKNKAGLVAVCRVFLWHFAMQFTC